jgi:hypothetical protein
LFNRKFYSVKFTRAKNGKDNRRLLIDAKRREKMVSRENGVSSFFRLFA